MRLPATLRSRLVLLVLASIVPLIGLSVGKAMLSTDTAITRATANLQSAAQLVALNQRQVTDSAYQVLLAISSAPQLAEPDIGACSRYLQTLRKQLPVYANLGIIGLDGNFRCHSLDQGTLPYAGDRLFFSA